MGIYNAYCDRVPIMVFTGNAGPIDERRPGVEWFHSVQDGASTVRDFVKWDDYPMSLQHFAESTVRGYTLACAQPPGPVFITADAKLQESPLEEREQRGLTIPRLTMPAQTTGDPNALREAAKMLVAAEAPVIIADRYARSQQAMDDRVGIEQRHAKPPQHCRGGALAHADRAGEAEGDHAAGQRDNSGAHDDAQDPEKGAFREFAR